MVVVPKKKKGWRPVEIGGGGAGYCFPTKKGVELNWGDREGAGLMYCVCASLMQVMVTRG